MKVKKVVLFIVTIAITLFLNFVNVLAAYRAPVLVAKYNSMSLIISIIMKLSTCIILISYLVLIIIYMIKSKEGKIKKIKKMIKWFMIVVIISLILWFGSEPVKEIAMTVKYD